MLDFITIDWDKGVTSLNLADAISKNRQIAIAMEKEIRNLKKKSSYKEREKMNTKSSQIQENLSKEIQRVSDFSHLFEEKFDYYYFLLDSLEEKDTTISQIKTNLPSIDDASYDDLLLRLKLELIKRIKEVKEFLEENRTFLDQEDVKEFKGEISLYQKKLKFLKEVRIEQEELHTEENQNHFFFATTSGGKIRVLDEITKLAKTNVEYCDSFLELFQSIQNGNFKDVKRFSRSNSKTAGVSEVRGFKTRVVFDRIGERDYVLITAFLKKSDNDKGYLESLELKIQSYLNQREKIQSNLENKEYRQLSEQYAEQLYDSLTNCKEESSVKMKALGGISNV